MNIWIGKKGDGAGDMIMVLWFFLLLALVAGGIALGMRVFFGAGYDVRAVEAVMLRSQLEACISDHEIAWEQEDSLYTTCGLLTTILNTPETQLGILVCEGTCLSGTQVFQVGSNFEACDFTGKNEQYARCSRGAAKQGTISYEIITLSNHGSRSVSS